MKHIVISVLLAASAIDARSESMVVDCPPTISVTEVPVEASPRKWEPRQFVTTRTLANLSIYDGHPDENASLKPDQEPSPTKTSAIWRFPKGARNLWLACAYRDTGATLARRLPDGVRQCTATYRYLSNNYEAVGTVVCE